jgi:hypothetical protein
VVEMEKTKEVLVVIGAILVGVALYLAMTGGL